MIYLHIEDERLKEMLDAIDDPDNAGYAAWQLVMQECGEGSSDLEIIKFQAAFNSATIVNTVGHKIDTMTAYARHLNALNVRIPQGKRFDNDA